MSDDLCCSEWKCRRKQPIEIQRAPLAGRWYAITRYKRDGSRIEAIEKHQLPGVVSAALDVAQRHMDEVDELLGEWQTKWEQHQAALADTPAPTEEATNGE